MNPSAVSFPCAGRNLKQVLQSPASWSLVSVVLGIQLIVAIGGGPDSLASWYVNLGLSREGFLSGKVWQVVSYGLLHGGWWHAVINALFVLVIGARIEHIAGKKAMLGVTVAGVFGGGFAHLVLGSGLLVGLSGGCLALLLLLTTLSPESRMFPLMVSGKSLGMGILAAELFLTLINPGLGLPGFAWIGGKLADQGMRSLFQMGHACHLGGGIAGWIFGRWILRPRITLGRLRRERVRREPG